MIFQRDMNGASRSQMTAGSLVLAGASATFIAELVIGGIHKASAFSGLGVLALMGLGLFSLGAMRVSSWASRRWTQFDAVIARLTEVAQIPPPPRAPSADQ